MFSPKAVEVEVVSECEHAAKGKSQTTDTKILMERTSSCCCCWCAISTMTANTIVLANGVGVSHRVSWWKYQSTYCLSKHFLCKERRSQMLFSQNRSTLLITVNIISVRARIVSMKVPASWHSDSRKQQQQHFKIATAKNRIRSARTVLCALGTSCPAPSTVVATPHFI